MRKIPFLTIVVGTIAACFSFYVIDASADYKADYYDYAEMVTV